MKTRKWLYFTATLATVYNMNLIKPEKIESLVKIISVPDDVLRWSLLGGCAYLLVIYLALTFQLITVYDLILAERLRFKKDDEIEKAQSKVDESRKDVIRLDEEKRQNKNLGGMVMAGAKVYSADEHDAATSVYNRNVENLSRIIKSDPSERFMFRKIEMVVDSLRVFGPIALSITAMILLVLNV